MTAPSCPCSPPQPSASSTSSSSAMSSSLSPVASWSSIVAAARRLTPPCRWRATRRWTARRRRRPRPRCGSMRRLGRWGHVEAHAAIAGVLHPGPRGEHRSRMRRRGASAPKNPSPRSVGMVLVRLQGQPLSGAAARIVGSLPLCGPLRGRALPSVAAPRRARCPTVRWRFGGLRARGRGWPAGRDLRSIVALAESLFDPLGRLPPCLRQRIVQARVQ